MYNNETLGIATYGSFEDKLALSPIVYTKLSKSFKFIDSAIQISGKKQKANIKGTKQRKIPKKPNSLRSELLNNDEDELNSSEEDSREDESDLEKKPNTSEKDSKEKGNNPKKKPNTSEKDSKKKENNPEKKPNTSEEDSKEKENIPEKKPNTSEKDSKENEDNTGKKSNTLEKGPKKDQSDLEKKRKASEKDSENSEKEQTGYDTFPRHPKMYLKTHNESGKLPIMRRMWLP